MLSLPRLPDAQPIGLRRALRLLVASVLVCAIPTLFVVTADTAWGEAVVFAQNSTGGSSDEKLANPKANQQHTREAEQVTAFGYCFEIEHHGTGQLRIDSSTVLTISTNKMTVRRDYDGRVRLAGYGSEGNRIRSDVKPDSVVEGTLDGHVRVRLSAGPHELECRTDQLRLMATGFTGVGEVRLVGVIQLRSLNATFEFRNGILTCRSDTGEFDLNLKLTGGKDR